MYSFRDVGVLALAPSKADGGAEEGAEGDASAAFPVLPRGLNLFLARDLKNNRSRRRLIVTVNGGDCPVGLAEDMG